MRELVGEASCLKLYFVSLINTFYCVLSHHCSMFRLVFFCTLIMKVCNVSSVNVYCFVTLHMGLECMHSVSVLTAHLARLLVLTEFV